MADLPPGTYRGVRCKKCNAKGNVTIREDGTASETTKHRASCPYAPQQPSHLRKRRAQIRRQERDIAKLTGTRPTAASGALNGDGDSRRVGWFRVEDKSTETGRWVLTKTFWSKLCKGSLKNDEEPLFVVDFIEGRLVRRLAVMRLKSWLADGGTPPSQELHPARTAYHLLRDTRTGSSILGLDPPAVVMDLDVWSHKYQGTPR